MYAAKLNSLAMVKVLVEYKPDVTITDAVSTVYLHYIQCNNQAIFHDYIP